jgi:hypothetical protein
MFLVARASLRQSAQLRHSLSLDRRRPNGAEFGVLRPYVRTTDTGRGGRFGAFLVSLGPLSPKQPNHGHFGTDVESSIIQWVTGCPKGVGFEKPPLRRREQGSNCWVRHLPLRTTIHAPPQLERSAAARATAANSARCPGSRQAGRGHPRPWARQHMEERITELEACRAS